MDSHKLIYHPERVAAWRNGENIYPICIEISPSGNCNHRCIFCGLDYLEYKPVFLDKDLIVDNLKQMKEKGLKSVVIAGEGEPLLNKHTSFIINRAREFNIDVAMSSNGVLFDRQFAVECLKALTWVRFSINAGNDKNHQLIHKSRPGDFHKTLENIKNAVDIKKKHNLKTTIGVQLVLLPQNVNDVIGFAKQLKELKVDYFTVKPYSQHPKSNVKIDNESINYDQFLFLEEQLNLIANQEFKIIFRSESMKRKKERKCYDRCLGHPFWAYIDANAKVWACIAYIGDPEFFLGSLKHNSFVELWEGKERDNFLNKMKVMDVRKCRELCRLDEINKYLHELTYSGEHVNFI
ncbi:MAG: radical SAM protein [Clostridia bacterium]|nr:radical SAM protein [Clostridia bacterium]